MGLGLPRLARAVQRQPPAAPSLPLAAGLQGQPLSLGFALQPFAAIMGQLQKCLVMHHGVSSSLFPGVVRVGLCKWARFRCSRNEHPFLVELQMPMFNTPS